MEEEDKKETSSCEEEDRILNKELPQSNISGLPPFSTLDYRVVPIQKVNAVLWTLCQPCMDESNRRYRVLRMDGKQVVRLVMCQNCAVKNQRIFDALNDIN